MNWVLIAAWIAAAVVAVVVLGYCAYEILWKAKRLRSDLAELQALAAQVQDVQRRLADAQERLALARLG